MTSCCRSGPAEQMFRPETARQSLASYRKKGLGALSRRMVEAAAAGGLDGARVLDIGGGIGAVQAELLERGADAGEIVELVSSYEKPALELAADKGLAGRVSFRVADILDSPEAVQPADVVIMNRVVCCSPDGIELAAAAARLARRTFVLSFPRTWCGRAPAYGSSIRVSGPHGGRFGCSCIRPRGCSPQPRPRGSRHGNSAKPPLPRDQNLRRIRQIGRQRWKIESGYHRRSLAETTVFRFKAIFGGSLTARTLDRQIVEALLKCKALNVITRLGLPDSYPVSA